MKIIGEVVVYTDSLSKDLGAIIGVNGKLPSYSEEEINKFKENTIGKRCIMGGVTYRSLSKPLSDRTNIVLTKRNYTSVDGVIFCKSKEEVMELVSQPEDESDIVVIGGKEIYNLFKDEIDLWRVSYMSKQLELKEGDKVTRLPDEIFGRNRIVNSTRYETFRSVLRLKY